MIKFKFSKESVNLCQNCNCFCFKNMEWSTHTPSCELLMAMLISMMKRDSYPV